MITDHEFEAWTDGSCYECGYARHEHAGHEDEYDGDYPNGPERDTLDEFGPERHELGE